MFAVFLATRLRKNSAGLCGCFFTDVQSEIVFGELVVPTLKSSLTHDKSRLFKFQLYVCVCKVLPRLWKLGSTASRYQQIWALVGSFGYTVQARVPFI